MATVVGDVVGTATSAMSSIAATVCPRCQQSLAASDVGAGVLRCVACGCFVCQPAATTQLRRFLRVADDVWAELLEHGGRGARCSACTAQMRIANLKGVVVDGCPACGTLLLDPGELQRLTGRAEPAHVPAVVGRADDVDHVDHVDHVDAHDHVEHDAGPLPGRVFVPPRVGLQNFLGSTPWVQLSQQRHVQALTFSIDVGARYLVRTADGSGTVGRLEGPAALLKRMFLGAFMRQPFSLKDPRDNPLLVLERHFDRLLRSRLDVFLDDGARDPGDKLGSVERDFAWTETRYELKDARGAVFARLVRPALKLWQFRLERADGVVVGAVAKQWSGLVTEWLSDSDDFGIDFGTHRWSLEQRATIVAAALSIDLDLFERGNTTRDRSLLDVLT
ncbi:MAG TPA: phospholipid scramblase-related protein [Myxococcota bacterium]